MGGYRHDSARDGVVLDLVHGGSDRLVWKMGGGARHENKFNIVLTSQLHLTNVSI